jgi:glycosyltransferase involved in cell wall biosynthesis
MPTVSVVLPTYNRAHLLPKAVESVLAQSYSDFELIIVDDGSKDSTKSVVEAIKDPRVRYIQHDTNRGLAAGRNTGARAAVGKFIANQDSDDMWLPGKLGHEVQALEQAPREVGVVYSRLEKVFPDGRIAVLPLLPAPMPSGNIYKTMLEGNFITMQVSLMRKECFEAVGGFDEQVIALQDWDFWIRVTEKYQFVGVPEVGARATISPDSITKNKLKRLQAREFIFNKHSEAFKQYPEIYAKHAFSVGHAYALRGTMDKAHTYLKKAMGAQNTTVKYTLAYLLSLSSSPIVYKTAAKLYL